MARPRGASAKGGWVGQVAGAPAELKVKDLTPASKSVNLTVKVVSLGPPQSVASRDGGTRRVTEAVVGDETGTVIMSLWDDQAGTASPGAVLRVENGYVALVRGHVHLNVGRYGRMTTSSKAIGEVNAAFNVSEVDHAPQRGMDRDLGGAVDLRFRRGPMASTGYGLDDDARARGIRVKRRPRERDRLY